VIEEDGFELSFECRSHEAPHILIATETVRENHSAVSGSTDPHVVALQNCQG
jgi:hypothetical protein